MEEEPAGVSEHVKKRTTSTSDAASDVEGKRPRVETSEAEAAVESTAAALSGLGVNVFSQACIVIWCGVPPLRSCAFTAESYPTLGVHLQDALERGIMEQVSSTIARREAKQRKKLVEKTRADIRSVDGCLAHMSLRDLYGLGTCMASGTVWPAHSESH